MPCTEQLKDAGLIDAYTTLAGERWPRLTRAGERIARQLALMPVGPGDEMVDALIEAAREAQARKAGIATASSVPCS
jgi:hypothetical protein